jgi:cardiolipin synthase
VWDVLWPIIYVVAHACLLVRAITRPNRTPAARVAWVAVILAIPVVGFISYLALGETDIGAPRVRRLREAEEALAAVPTTAAPAEVHEPARAMSDLLQSINGYAPVAGNRIELLGDPDAPPSEPKRDRQRSGDGAPQLLHLAR